jgi:hypothetical protein
MTVINATALRQLGGGGSSLNHDVPDQGKEGMSWVYPAVASPDAFESASDKFVSDEACRTMKAVDIEDGRNSIGLRKAETRGGYASSM